MPPKIQASVAVKDGAATSSKLTSMPPPPDPPAPRAILEPEVLALSTCLKNAAVRMGQIYGFYADASRLGIEAQVQRPPRPLTAALGREIEKYDQLVDSIESQILRAISVLQRDLVREEKRAQLAAEAAMSAQTDTQRPPASPTLALVPTDISGITTSQGAPLPTPTSSPPAPLSSASVSRRPSAISISSLHRPAFPLKLDLSSSALRFNPEETFSSGLASPVTLAPKSARAMGPNEYPPELMAFVSSNPVLERPVDIDLTLPDDDTTDADGKLLNVGNTADKPIELDLDAMDIDMANLFGDISSTEHNNSTPAMGDLFPPMAVDTDGNSADVQASDRMQPPILDSLGQSGNDDDLFASLGVNADQAAGAQQSHTQSTDAQPVSLPDTLFANFDSTTSLQGIDALSANNGTASNAPFDLGIDFSLSPSFFSNPGDSDVKFPMEMDQFLAVGTSEGKEAEEDKKSGADLAS